MIETYRSMAPLPPCWCRCYPAGTIFSGWEKSVLHQETKISNMLDVHTRQHSPACLRERDDRRTINVIAYDRNNDSSRCKSCSGGSCFNCLGTGRDLFAVRLWRWKTKPLFWCYFLLHKWEVVSLITPEREKVFQQLLQGRQAKITIPVDTIKSAIFEVCACGADRLTLYHNDGDRGMDQYGFPAVYACDSEWVTSEVTNMTAAWDNHGTSGGGPG